MIRALRSPRRSRVLTSKVEELVEIWDSISRIRSKNLDVDREFKCVEKEGEI